MKTNVRNGGGQPLNKRAFTLIELLAVIVILAIIALIATPIVLDIIEDARRESTERSMENIEKAAELYYYENDLNYAFTGITFICKEGVCSNGEETLNISGKGPENGTIKIDSKGNITLNSIVINGYSCYKDGDSYSCEKSSKATDKTNNGVLTLNESKTTTLSNYIIKGNSYQETRSGKNLFDCKSFVNNAKELGAGNSISIIEGGIKLNHMDYQEKYSKLNLNLKEKTVYTLSADVNWVSYTSDSVVIGFVIYYDDGTKSRVEIGKNTTKINFTSLTDKTIVAISTAGWGYQGEVNITNIQLEKGAKATVYEPYGVMPSPEYPSEIQSVGDLVTDSSDPNYGKYEIPIRVTDKNLFGDKLLKDKLVSVANATVDKDEKTVSFLASNINEDTILEGVFEENTQYTFMLYGENEDEKYQYSNLVVEYTDGTKEFLVFEEIGTPSYIVYHTIAGKTVKELSGIWVGGITKFYYEKCGVFKGLLIEEEFEFYEEEIYNIYLDEPLRCVGNVCDYIDYESGKVVRAIKADDIPKITTYIPAKKSNVCWFTINAKYLSKHIIDCNVFSPIFKSIQNTWWQDEEGILSHKLNTGGIYFSLKWERLGLIYDGTNVYMNEDINKTTPLSDTDIYNIGTEYFLNAFSEDERTVYYPFETPIEEEIDLPEININRGVSNIFIETDIKPSEFVVEYYK